MELIWVTRGRDWGTRILRGGGHENPLRAYETAFSAVGDETEVWQLAGNCGALRFEDPMGRRDRAGRVIMHEFVVTGPLATEITSVETGRQMIWPVVEAEFDPTTPAPPAAE